MRSWSFLVLSATLLMGTSACFGVGNCTNPVDELDRPYGGCTNSDCTVTCSNTGTGGGGVGGLMSKKHSPSPQIANFVVVAVLHTSSFDTQSTMRLWKPNLFRLDLNLDSPIAQDNATRQFTRRLHYASLRLSSATLPWRRHQ